MAVREALVLIKGTTVLGEKMQVKVVISPQNVTLKTHQ